MIYLPQGHHKLNCPVLTDHMVIYIPSENLLEILPGSQATFSLLLYYKGHITFFIHQDY